MIDNFLNKKFSTRNLSDEEFETILPILAKELSKVNYEHTYSDESLFSDWNKLLNCATNINKLNSTSRVGIKLCEHFFPNFFDIKNNKGKSFSTNWNSSNLEKVLRWNRKSHSTPYLSEIRRGIYFCTGLTKNTMYRPHLAKIIVSNFDGDVVLDPCMGWGGRLLGTVAAGKKYIGFDPNKETFNNLKRLVKFLNIEDRVELYNVGAEYIQDHISESVDIILTSPPYFNLEIYSESPTQSENQFINYDEWLKNWLEPVILNCLSLLNKNGTSCWNVHNVGKMKMIDDVMKIHNKTQYKEHSVYSIQSSKRQANQNQNKNAKNKDVTICYKK